MSSFLTYLNSTLKLGDLDLNHRLIQGPLAGFSCAPFRMLFSVFQAPAYCVSEMISAYDIVHKHAENGRYLYRSPKERLLCYQISGNDPEIMAGAATKLAGLKADIIDINCGCPKSKIRKKGAGSALLENPERLIKIVKAVREAIQCPFTVKIRLQNNKEDDALARAIADAGADALIVHGRTWQQDYDIACDWHKIAKIKTAIDIPLIANGDIADHKSLEKIYEITGCDGFMISRAGTGRPWLYAALLKGEDILPCQTEIHSLFIEHLKQLAELENEFQAVLQSKSLLRYYLGKDIDPVFLKEFYGLTSISDIEKILFNR